MDAAVHKSRIEVWQGYRSARKDFSQEKTTLQTLLPLLVTLLISDIQSLLDTSLVESKTALYSGRQSLQLPQNYRNIG